MRFTSLLVGELLVGSAPGTADHLDILELEGVNAILSLCEESEAPPPSGLAERFVHSRRPLPDHAADRAPTVQELEEVIVTLDKLSRSGPVYVHCVAGVERSPLVAMAWLLRRHGLGFVAALDYVQETHRSTNPAPEQLNALLSWHRAEGPESSRWIPPRLLSSAA
jgi:phosphoglycolate phosphatase-like HAD superfamily hydrolase